MFVPPAWDPALPPRKPTHSLGLLGGRLEEWGQASWAWGGRHQHPQPCAPTRGAAASLRDRAW